MTRMEFPVSVRKAAWARCKGNCEANTCGLPIRGRPEYDHILPNALGGKPELSNCAVLCKPCHRAKTRRDKAHISKADRIKAKNTGTRFKRQGNPLPGTKASNWKHKMNGEWERR